MMNVTVKENLFFQIKNTMKVSGSLTTSKATGNLLDQQNIKDIG